MKKGVKIAILIAVVIFVIILSAALLSKNIQEDLFSQRTIDYNTVDAGDLKYIFGDKIDYTDITYDINPKLAKEKFGISDQLLIELLTRQSVYEFKDKAVRDKFYEYMYEYASKKTGSQKSAIGGVFVGEVRDFTPIKNEAGEDLSDFRVSNYWKSNNTIIILLTGRGVDAQYGPRGLENGESDIIADIHIAFAEWVMKEYPVTP